MLQLVTRACCKYKHQDVCAKALWVLHEQLGCHRVVGNSCSRMPSCSVEQIADLGEPEVSHMATFRFPSELHSSCRNDFVIPRICVYRLREERGWCIKSH